MSLVRMCDICSFKVEVSEDALPIEGWVQDDLGREKCSQCIARDAQQDTETGFLQLAATAIEAKPKKKRKRS